MGLALRFFPAASPSVSGLGETLAHRPYIDGDSSDRTKMSEAPFLLYWVESNYSGKRERRKLGVDHLPAIRVFAIPARRLPAPDGPLRHRLSPPGRGGPTNYATHAIVSEESKRAALLPVPGKRTG